jgi:hypothetical protein
MTGEDFVYTGAATLLSALLYLLRRIRVSGRFSLRPPGDPPSKGSDKHDNHDTR